jgi:hypothetical protein
MRELHPMPDTTTTSSGLRPHCANAFAIDESTE